MLNQRILPRKKNSVYSIYSSEEDEHEYPDGTGEASEEYVEAKFPVQVKAKVPKKCRRKDACYIIPVCIYCKPFWKKNL